MSQPARLRRSLVAAFTALLVVSSAGAALADNLHDDVTAGGNDTFVAGSSTTISYWVGATGSDGCDASDGTPVTITPSVAAAVTVSPTSQTIALCKAGSNNNSKSFTFASSQPGDYPVTLGVSDAGGDTYNLNPAALVIHVQAAPNSAPSVGQISGSATANEGSSQSYSVVASDPDAGDTLTYAWSVTGGNASISGAANQSSVSVAFSDGPSTVGLQVVVDDGHSHTTTRTLSITETNVAPTGTMSNNGPMNEGSSAIVSLAGADASSADAAALRYAFDCAGGTLASATYANSGTAASTSCSFGDGPSSHVVSGRVFDKDGGSAGYTTTVSVQNVAPTATFSGPAAPPAEGSDFTVSFSNPSDPSTADTTAGFHYAFACDGQSLDSADYAGSGTASSAICDYDDGPSTHTVKGRIIDQDGGYTESTLTVSATNVAPTATLSNNGPVGEGSPATISFGNQSDPSTADTNAGFHYAFACNGESLASKTYANSGSAASVSCTYADGPSTYTVTGIIFDDDNGSLTTTTDVSVANVAPTVALTGDESADEGQTKTYSFTVSDPGTDTFTAGTPNCGAAGTYVAGSLAATATGGSFDCTFPNGPDSSTVSIQVTDSDGAASNTGSVTVTIANVAPTVSLSGATSANEGDAKSYSFSVTDPGTDTFTAGTPNCGTAGTYVANSLNNTATGGSFNCTFPDGPDSSTVSIQVTDSDGAASNTDSVTVTIANVAPTVALTGDESADEGQTKTYSFTVSDPGTDGFTAGTPNCGAAGTYVANSLNSTATGGSFNCSFPDGNASSSVTIQVTDSDGASSNTGSVTVTIANVAPTVALTGDEGADEGQTKTYSFTVSDPGTDGFTAGTPNCGTAGTYVANSLNSTATGGSFNCSFPDGNASSSVTIQVTDSDGASSNTGDRAVTVANVAPIINTVTLTGGNATACLSGNSVSLNIVFSDPAGSLDTYTGEVNWGDGSTSTFSTSGVSLPHTYSGAGTFTISVNVSDEDGGVALTQTATASFSYNLGAIQAPFNADGSSVFKYGSTIPVKVRITDCSGAPVPGLTPQVFASKLSSLPPSDSINETPSTSAADTTGVMRYDPTAGQYIYNFASKYLTDATATYYMYVAEYTGSSVHVKQRFSLKSK